MTVSPVLWFRLYARFTSGFLAFFRSRSPTPHNCPWLLVTFIMQVGKCAFVPEAKPGYMPTVTVLFSIEFGAPDGGSYIFSFILRHRLLMCSTSPLAPSLPPQGTRLFERDVPDKPFVEPGDVRQGCLGDCYVLGALSSMAVNQQLLLDVFPDLPPELTVEDPTSPAGEQVHFLSHAAASPPAYRIALDCSVDTFFDEFVRQHSCSAWTSLAYSPCASILRSAGAL